MIKKIGRFCVAYLISYPFMLIHAAVPPSLSQSAANHNRSVYEALRLPLENRLQALKQLNHTDLVAGIVFDRSQELELRWRALTILPALDSDRAKLVIEKALTSKEWYLRNAAAVALPAMSRDFALSESMKLLDDPALVIRTAAVQNVIKLKGNEVESILWQKLHSRENFRNGESLWIRRHIVKALAQFADKGDEGKFITLLNDSDSRLHPFALQALEKLTGIKQPRQAWFAWGRQQVIKTN